MDAEGIKSAYFTLTANDRVSKEYPMTGDGIADALQDFKFEPYRNNFIDLAYKLMHTRIAAYFLFQGYTVRIGVELNDGYTATNESLSQMGYLL